MERTFETFVWKEPKLKNLEIIINKVELCLCKFVDGQLAYVMEVYSDFSLPSNVTFRSYRRNWRCDKRSQQAEYYFRLFDS